MQLHFSFTYTSQIRFHFEGNPQSEINSISPGIIQYIYFQSYQNEHVLNDQLQLRNTFQITGSHFNNNVLFEQELHWISRQASLFFTCHFLLLILLPYANKALAVPKLKPALKDHTKCWNNSATLQFTFADFWDKLSSWVHFKDPLSPPDLSIYLGTGQKMY